MQRGCFLPEPLTAQLKEQRCRGGEAAPPRDEQLEDHPSCCSVGLEGLHPSVGLEELSWREKILLRLEGWLCGNCMGTLGKSKDSKVPSRDTTESRDGSRAVSPAATSGSRPACCRLSSLLKLAEHPWIPSPAQFSQEIPNFLLWQQSAQWLGCVAFPSQINP